MRGQMVRATHSKPRSSAVNWLVPVVVLWLLVMASALAVVASTQEVRQRVDALQTLRREAVELEVVWGQYLLEQSTWAAYGRIERIAENDLAMKVPEAEQIVMVRPRSEEHTSELQSRGHLVCCVLLEKKITYTG